MTFFAPHFSFFGHLLPITVSYCGKLQLAQNDFGPIANFAFLVCYKAQAYDFCLCICNSLITIGQCVEMVEQA